MTTGPVFTLGSLNLRDPDGWYVGEGVDLGRRSLTKRWLSQDGVDGAELASVWANVVTMTIPLVLTEQPSAAAQKSLVDSLNAQLNADTNVLTYMPHGLVGTAYLIDTYKAEQISLLNGVQNRSPWVGRDGWLIVVQIDRQPDMRGGGIII